MKGKKLHGCVLIIGGAGSLGTELTRILLSRSVRSIRILDNSEAALYRMKQQFGDNRKLRMLLGDVRNSERLTMAMDGCDYVVVCAAVKSVDIGQENVMEVVDVNVGGAFGVVREAYRSRPKKVLFLSSDKAILSDGEPATYHATKFIVEELSKWANKHSNLTRFSCIRPANFIPSNMSFTETWFKAYTENNKIPVTSPEATRYFIPIGKAAQCTLHALKIMRGGEIFVPKGSHEYNILNLAKRLNVPYTIIGPRKGDRNREKLMTDTEREQATDAGDLWVIHPV